MRLARLLTCTLVLLAGLGLAGCDDEAAHRKAFIEFLQTRIVAKPGVHVPKLTEEETKSFGEYAKHYAIIADFNDGMTKTISGPMDATMQRLSIRSLQDVLAQRDDIARVRAGLAELRAALDRQLAQADAAHAALHQPDDLRPVFDAAYERDVTRPARVFAEVFPAVDETTGAVLDLADFLTQHRAEIRVDGATVQVANPALQREVAARLGALSGKAQQVAAAQQKLRMLILGS